MRRAWFEPEDAAALGAFRVFFGLVMAVDALRYLLAGWITSYFVEPTFHFAFLGFEWVAPLPSPWLHALFVALVVAGLLVAAGVAYRAACAFLFIGHTYVFLLDATNYLNHAYLLCLLTFLMIWLPADRAFTARCPAGLVPRWPRLLLRTQIAIVYVYGGLAKIDPDWLSGHPLQSWLRHSARDLPWAARLLVQPEFARFIAWGGLAFDLLIVPALVWRRTRGVAVAASIAFHLANANLFRIGVFPYLMLACMTLFLAPDWPRRVPGLAARIPPPPTFFRPRPSPAIVGFFFAWTAIQIVLPLRPHLASGDVAWNEEGHYFSWRMKLRAKRGNAVFELRDPQTGRSWVVLPSEELTPRQEGKMAGKPDLILQYAHHLAEQHQAALGRPVEVRARVRVSLNDRPPQDLVDPTVDLAAQPRGWGSYAWVSAGPRASATPAGASGAPRPR